MAYALMEIRKQHIDSLRKTIEDAPYVYLLNVCKYAGVESSLDEIKGHIDKAVQLGIISRDEPDFMWKSFLVARLAIEERLRGYDGFLDDVNSASEKAVADGVLDINDPDFLLKSFAFTIYNHKENDCYSVDGARSFIKEFLEENPFVVNSSYYVYCSLMFPLQRAILFITKNYPIALATLLKKWTPEGEENKAKYMRVPLSESFAFLKGMTLFGQRRLLADICPSYCEDELVEAIQKGDYEEFKEICRSEKLTLSTELSESVGYLQYYFYIPLERMINEDINNEEVDRQGDPYPSFMLYSFGQSPDNMQKLMSSFADQKANLLKLFPWIHSDEDFSLFAMATLFVSSMYSYFDLFEVDEAEVVNILFENPRLQSLVKIAQSVYYGTNKRWPKYARILASPEEERTILNAKIEEDGASQDNNDVHPLTENHSEERTLASRWMTEAYQRMSDDVLVELVSKQIWPSLMAEIDGLQWTPARRGLPSFPKIKNMLAACILFHALELAKIAKLPKQEEQVNDYDGLYGEEDRALTGVVSTSDLRAGITHTQKKYNDTLPVGYMEVLKMFLAADEMPGRTTSRNYLKLVNKWLRIKYEDYVDNLDSAKGRLLAAECQKDLGPQLYLLTDNKKRMRAILKEWRDLVPKLFNIPI